MEYKSIILNPETDWKSQLLNHAEGQECTVFLDSNGNTNTSHSSYDWLCAGMPLGISDSPSLSNLRKSHSENPGWWFGRLNYDLKNQIENLSSDHAARMRWPDVRFFQAGWVVCASRGEVKLYWHPEAQFSPDRWQEDVITATSSSKSSAPIELIAGMSRSEYLDSARHLLDHIQRGDIYEVNFCQEFYAEAVELNPIATFRELQEVAEPTMSALWHFKNEWALSMSPERYLRKSGDTLISQPIKGTSKRHVDREEDLLSAQALRNSRKEQAENVMIVDLVRNDLSRVAQRKSVKVTELFGIHSFKTVHQMISTVEAQLDDQYDIWDAIKASFPMGSMTGAPKVSAMKLIEKYETHKRELYSGAIGYITPDGDFDFNVVIRTVLFDSDLNRVSVSVGSALTSQAEPKQEYDECLLKLEAIRKVLAREHESTH